MRTASDPRRRAGYGRNDALIVIVVLALAFGIALPMIAYAKKQARRTRNAKQLRGIFQGMFTFAQSSRTGAGDGWYPGFHFYKGTNVPLADVIPASYLAATHDVPGYAAVAGNNVLPGEMNTNPHQGFIVRAFAELAAGDFIPMGSTDYFINPADTLKTAFVAGDTGPAGRFGADNISYTTLNVSANDAGLFPLKAEWKETGNPDAILIAGPCRRQRQRSRRGLERLDRTRLRPLGRLQRPCRRQHHRHRLAPRRRPALRRRHRRRGHAGEPLPPPLLRHRPSTPTAPAAEISADSGVLYDEADSGTDPGGF